MGERELKRALRAKDEFQDTFGLLLHNLVYNFSVDVMPIGSLYGLSVRCWFANPDEVSPRRKQAILDLFQIDGDFTFEQTLYPISVAFTRVPDSFQE